MIHSHCTAITILPEGEPLFSERATEIKIVDEAAGPFLEITQTGVSGNTGTIQIDSPEWPAIREAVEKLLETCAMIEKAGNKDAQI